MGHERCTIEKREVQEVEIGPFFIAQVRVLALPRFVTSLWLFVEVMTNHRKTIPIRIVWKGIEVNFKLVIFLRSFAKSLMGKSKASLTSILLSEKISSNLRMLSPTCTAGWLRTMHDAWKPLSPINSWKKRVWFNSSTHPTQIQINSYHSFSLHPINKIINLCHPGA